MSNQDVASQTRSVTALIRLIDALAKKCRDKRDDSLLSLAIASLHAWEDGEKSEAMRLTKQLDELSRPVAPE